MSEAAQEKLMSDDIAELAKALAIAQGQMKGASKDATNPHYGKTYASLDSVIDAIREPFSKNGLSYVQIPFNENGTPRIGVKTILLHVSGQYISSALSMMPVKSDPQGVGSLLTYCRRYTLMAIAGVAPEDDDGNTASLLGEQSQLSPQEEWERQRGIKPHTDKGSKQKQNADETPEQKAKREVKEIGEQRAAIMNAMPKDIQEYFIGAKKTMKLGEWFKMVADNNTDPELIRGWMKDHPLVEIVEMPMKGEEGMP